MWALAALTSAFCDTLRDVGVKRIGKIADEFTTSFAIQFFTALIILPVLLLIGLPSINGSIHLALLYFLIISPIAVLLYTRAVASSPLSVCAPMLALSPVISAFLSLGLSGKPIPPPGWLGIFLITIGLYILLAGPRATRGSFKDSVVRIFSDPGTLAMLGVAIVTSVSVYVGQYTISHSSRIFYAFSMNLTSAIGLLAIALPLKKIDRSFFHKEKIKKFLTMGTANAGMTLSLAVALGATSAAYALSLKRTNIIWSALMGRMIFGEKLDARKIIAIGITFIGILLIIL